MSLSKEAKRVQLRISLAGSKRASSICWNLKFHWSLGSSSAVRKTLLYSQTSSAENPSRSSNLPLGHLATSVIRRHSQTAALTFNSISGRHYCCAKKVSPLNHWRRRCISMCQLPGWGNRHDYVNEDCSGSSPDVCFPSPQIEQSLGAGYQPNNLAFNSLSIMEASGL